MQWLKTLRGGYSARRAGRALERFWMSGELYEQKEYGRLLLEFGPPEHALIAPGYEAIYDEYGWDDSWYVPLGINNEERVLWYAANTHGASPIKITDPTEYPFSGPTSHSEAQEMVEQWNESKTNAVIAQDVIEFVEDWRNNHGFGS